MRKAYEITEGFRKKRYHHRTEPYIPLVNNILCVQDQIAIKLVFIILGILPLLTGIEMIWILSIFPFLVALLLKVQDLHGIEQTIVPYLKSGHVAVLPI
jgi:hypothetical protein